MTQSTMTQPKNFIRRIVAVFVALACLSLPSVTVAQDTPASVEAQAAAPAPQSTARASPSVSTYRINPGDEIEIYVWGEERLQRQLRVLPDGSIAFPLVGQLQVAGSLPQEVEQMVSAQLTDQYRGEVPVVTVSVIAPTGLQFSVLGKVRSPGAFTVGRYVNVLDALSLAGGPTEFANLGNVLVITQRDGAARTFTVKLDDLFRSGANRNDITQASLAQIMPGDVIIVP